MFGRLFSRSAKAGPAAPATPGDALVYAVGDVHGRLDLLNALIRKIVADAQELRPTRRPWLVFLGDYVDRGPSSRGVIDRILDLQRGGAFQVHALRGNHDEQMRLFLADAVEGPPWAEFGGAATLASYGVTPPPPRADAEAWEAARLALAEALPPEHLAFLEALELSLVCGDYIFVHAGLRPGVPLDEQTDRDMMWIRDEFLTTARPFDKVVVHGHTPEIEPHSGPVRIGVDTGAYATGTLTAVRLQGADRVMLQTGLRSAAA